MPVLNPYEILGVPRDATHKQIKQAYMRQSLSLHPDKVAQKGGSEAEKTAAKVAFQHLQAAYQILSDREKRKEYDEEQGQSDSVYVMTEPPDLDRPSVRWANSKTLYEELYQQHPLEEIEADQRVSVLKKSIPLNNSHFSPLCYQNFYVLTKQDEQGNTIDEQFSDVFALIEEKKRRFNDTLPMDIASNLTPEVALGWLLGFLKGTYYGIHLIQLQSSLEAGIHKKSTASGLYQAVLKFISVNNLKINYQEALNALQGIHDWALAQYKSIEGQSALYKKMESLAQDEYNQQLSHVKKAQDSLNINTQDYQEKHDKLLQLQEALSVVESEIQATKVMHDQLNIEAEFERLETIRFNIQQDLETVEEQYTIAKATMENAQAKLTEQSNLLPSLQARIEELKKHQQDLQEKKFNERFLDLIESKYYKLTLASIVSCYWNDTSPIATPQLFDHMASILSHIPLEFRKKLAPIGQVSVYADDHLKQLAQDLTVDQYCEHAHFFYDLYATLPVAAVRVNAMMMAGLCWQMAARKADNPHQQMALEMLALQMYQITIKQATRLPASYALYVMIHVPKYLSELRYNQNTLGLSDYRKLAANRHSRYEKVSPDKYNFYEVQGGSALESMEGAMDRAFYLISYFPMYSDLTHLLDQLSRQRCYGELQSLVLERFKNKQDQESTVMDDDAELNYYVYQAALKSNTTSEAELNRLRLRTMSLLLDQSNTSLMALNQLMNAPYVSMPQHADGFWTTGPLNYPDNPDSMGLIIYKSFDGYSLNTKTGDIQFFLTRWMPGDAPSERLFTHADLLDFIKGGIGGAIFSLDANSVYRQFDPLQVVRMSQNIKNTEYSRCAFATDYIMKMASQGTEIKARPPYNIRAIDSLFKGLDESIQKELLVCTEETPSSESFKSQATRFWIQMGDIPRLEKKSGYNTRVRYGDPSVDIKKQLLTIDAHGNLVDAPIDLDDQSKEARFAAAFTKHYDKIAEKLPVFNQLKAFYAISGAIKELQEKRSLNKLLLGAYQDKLADSAFWQEQRDEERKKWTTMNWDEYLAKQIVQLTQLFNDDAHWEREIEDTVKSLESQRALVNHVEGEEYQLMVAELTEAYRSIAENMYTRYPRLRWSATNPGFITYIKDIFSKTLGLLSDSLDDQLSLKEKEAILQGIKNNLKSQLLPLYASLKPVMGTKPYNEAKMKLSQGDVIPMASMLAAYEVSNRLVRDDRSAEDICVLDTVKNDLVTALKSKWLTKLSNESVQILGQSSTKSVYTITDPIFIAVYNKTRSQIRESTIEANRKSIPNWSQFESKYLKDIDNLLDRDFSKQSQLVLFNEQIKETYEEKKLTWFSEIMAESPHIKSVCETKSESPDIIRQCHKAREPFYAAIDALFDGDSRAIALLINDVIFQDLITAIQNNTPKTSDAQTLWDMLLAKEIETQALILANHVKENQYPEYEHLIPFFGERPYEEAICLYVQGEPNVLIEAQVAEAIEQKRKEVVGDLNEIARTKVDTERRALETSIPETAKKRVDQLKDAITHHLEAQLDAFINGSKKALKEEIKDCERLEAGFSRIGLGKREEPNAPCNTEFRVPAIFSKRHETYVYGGVHAMPSFKAINELSAAARNLTCVSGIGGEWDIKRAKDTLRQCNSLDFGVQIAKRNLEYSIQWAEWSLRQEKITQHQFNLASNYQLGLLQSTMHGLANEPETPKTSLYHWRAASAAANVAAEMARDAASHTKPAAPYSPPSPASTPPKADAGVAAATTNAFMNYGQAVMRGAKQWGSDLVAFGQSAVGAVVDSAMIAAPHPMGLTATNVEKSEWRAQPFLQAAQQRMEGRVHTVSRVARSVASFATDAAILSSHPLGQGHFATSIEIAEWREGMRHVPVYQHVSKRMDERLGQVEEGVHSFLERSGPERVESIVRWSLHLFTRMIGTKIINTVSRFNIPAQSGKNIKRGYDPRTDKGPVLNAVRRDDRWSCDVPPAQSAVERTAQKQIMYRESTPVVQQQAKLNPQAPIVPISAPAASAGQAPIVDPMPRTPIIDSNSSQIRPPVSDPIPVIPMIDPDLRPGASSVHILSTTQKIASKGFNLDDLPLLVPKKSNVNAISHAYLDVVLDPAIAKAEGSYILPQFCVAPERYHTPESQALLQPWKSSESQSFYKKQHAVTERRRRKYERYISDVEKEAWSEFKSITREFSTSERDDAKKLFLGVLRYRENIETALYAKELKYINCGEQTATAFVDELIRIKNDHSSVPTQKIHIISLRSRKDDHAFIVSGSTTLEEACVNSGDAVAEILSSMDGMVIDYWNNPAAGGVRLSAEVAREQFIMYGPKVAAVLNQMFVEEYFTEEMHSQIQSMSASPELKSFLNKCAGPSLDEIQEKFSQLHQRRTPVQRKEQGHLPMPSLVSDSKPSAASRFSIFSSTARFETQYQMGEVARQRTGSSSKPDGSYQHLLANSPIFHNVFAATDGQIFYTPPVVRLYSMDEIKECQTRTRFLYAVTIENDLLVAPYYLEQERWTGRNFLKHDELTSGSPVYAAGELLVEKGEILEINERTGHYLVCGEHLATLVEKRFNQAGADVTGKFKFKHSLNIANGERKPIITYPALKGSAAATVDEVDSGGGSEPPFPPGSVGAAKAWSIKNRFAERGLPNKGKVRYVPPKGYNPIVPLPSGDHRGYIDRFGNEWVRGPSRTTGQDFEWDVRLSRTGERYFGDLEKRLERSFVKKKNDGPYVNISQFGRITH